LNGNIFNYNFGIKQISQKQIISLQEAASRLNFSISLPLKEEVEDRKRHKYLAYNCLP